MIGLFEYCNSFFVRLNLLLRTVLFTKIVAGLFSVELIDLVISSI